MAKKKSAAGKKRMKEAAKKTDPRKKPAAKKKATAPMKKKTAPARPTATPAKSSWLDESTDEPIIEAKARQLDSFLAAMADGKIEESEVKDQEKRLVALMKKIEPKLDAELHDQVTQLLCELTAYDLMQVLHAMEQARPKTVFQG